ncbi:hypothetical protein Esti_002257 [Eimeria stiedai]
MTDQQARESRPRGEGNLIPPGLPDATKAHADDKRAPVHSSKERRRSSILERFTAAMRRPLWFFPQSSVEPPLWDTAPFFWLPPIFGLSPSFWLLMFNCSILWLASYSFESTVCMTSLTVLLCLVGMCAHEFAYASAAYAGGAKSVAESGYLACDLLQYMDASDMLVSWLSIIFGGFIVPGARIYVDLNFLPAYVQTTELRNRRWRTATSLAGPLANLVLASVAGFIVHLYMLAKLASSEDLPFTLPMPVVSLIWMGNNVPLRCQPTRQAKALAAAMCGLLLLVHRSFIFLQIVSCILNLVPLPPFDGWNALEPYIPKTCWLKACIANDFVWERLCHLAVTLIFYLTVTHVPFAWEGLSLFVATISGLPSKAFLACMKTMMNPFSAASVADLSSALFMKL